MFNVSPWSLVRLSGYVHVFQNGIIIIRITNNNTGTYTTRLVGKIESEVMAVTRWREGSRV